MTFNHNNTQYTFLLRDLHKLWKTALVTNENMIPTPLALKNPYDNIEFSKHTLYNIYFTMLFSGLHIDPFIHYFFKVNFVLNKFVDDNRAYLCTEKSIKQVYVKYVEYMGEKIKKI